MKIRAMTVLIHPWGTLGSESHGSIKAEPIKMKKGMMIQKRIPPKITAINRWALLYSRSDHFLYLVMVVQPHRGLS
jgi:hypothetical protein